MTTPSLKNIIAEARAAFDHAYLRGELNIEMESLDAVPFKAIKALLVQQVTAAYAAGEASGNKAGHREGIGNLRKDILMELTRMRKKLHKDRKYAEALEEIRSFVIAARSDVGSEKKKD